MTAFLIIAGRFLIGAYFVQAGLRNFMKVPLHTDILGKKGVPMPRETLLAALALQVLGGLMVALGILPWLGAVGLIVFTVAANALYHNFTQFSGDERTSHLNSVLANAALVGGLLLVMAA
ncbi:MAG: DoxX family protein [Devosia nanyangense]|uniref:DoxX family protein n=1 Tax=Devosia nanyangense TaxID=1228055 RepID=A0A933NZ83_9HYPH|nr:DoxX family protein [Devosia nanyangense]